MPLPYAQVKDLYDTLHGAGAITDSLPVWSQQMNNLTGSDVYSEGLHDNWIKRTSHAIDKAIEWTGAPEVTGAFGRGVGSLFDMPDQGEAMGRGIPRTFVDIGSFFVPGLGPATALPRLAGAALMGGGHTYAETGSPAAGVVSGLTNAVLPGAVGMLEKSILKRVGAEKFVGDVLDSAATAKAGRNIFTGVDQFMGTTGQNALAWTGGQVGALGLMAGSEMATQALDPNQEVSNPLTKEFWLSQGIQQLPFFAMHGATRLFGPSAEAAKAKTRAAMDYASVLKFQDRLAEMKKGKEFATRPVPKSENPVVEAQNLAMMKKWGFVTPEEKRVVDDLVTRHLELKGGAEPVRDHELIDLEAAMQDFNPASGVFTGIESVPTISFHGVVQESRGDSNFIMVRADKSMEGQLARNGWNGPLVAIKEGDHVGWPTTKTGEAGKGFERFHRQEAGFDAPANPRFRTIFEDKNPEKTAADYATHLAEQEKSAGTNEKLTSVAWKAVDGTIITGAEAAREQSKYGPVSTAAEGTAGFVTDRGRFVSTAEGREIAKTVKQKQVEGVELQPQTVPLDPVVWHAQLAAEIAATKQRHADAQAKLPEVQAVLDNAKTYAEVANALQVLQEWGQEFGVRPRGDSKTYGKNRAALGDRAALQVEMHNLQERIAQKRELLLQHEAGTDILKRIALGSPEAAVIKEFYDHFSYNEQYLVLLPRAVAKWASAKELTPESLEKALKSLGVKLVREGNSVVGTVKLDAPSTVEGEAGGTMHDVVADTKVLSQAEQDELAHAHEVAEEVKGADDVVREVNASKAQKNAGSDPKVEAQFNLYKKSHPEADFQTDTNRFWEILWPARAHLNTEAPLVGKELSLFLQALEFKSLEGKEGDAVADFPVRPHVQEMLKWAEGRKVGEKVAGAVRRESVRVPEPYDPVELQRIKDYAIEGSVRDSVAALAKNATYEQHRALAQDLVDRHGPALERFLQSISERYMTAARSKFDRRGRTTINRDDLGGSPFYLERNILEEAVHHLTLNALEDPAMVHIKEQLNSMRELLISKLPVEERKAVQKALTKDKNNQNWMKRYVAGRETLDGLYKGDTAVSDKLYGLLNNEEFVAHGLLPTRVRKLLLETEARTKQGWFNKFKGYVKSLLGYSDGTANPTGKLMDEFLSHTSALMEHNSSVVDFYDYAERMLKGAGVSEVDSRFAVTKAARLLQEIDITKPVTTDALLAHLDTYNDNDLSRSHVEAQIELSAIVENPQHKEHEYTKQLLAEQGEGMTWQGIDALLSEGLLDAKAFQDVIAAAPPQLAKYLIERAKDLHQIVAPIHGALQVRNKGLINFTDADAIRKPFAEVNKALTEVLKAEAVREGNTRLAKRVSLMTADTMPERIAAAASGEFHDLEQKSFWSKVGDFVSRMGGKALSDFIQQGRQLSREDSRFARYFARASMVVARTGNRITEANKGFGHSLVGDKMEYNPQEVERMGKVLDRKDLLAAADAYVWANQQAGLGERSVKLLPHSHPEVAKALARLSPADQQLVSEFVGKMSLAKRTEDAATVSSAADEAAINAAKVLMKIDPRHKPDAAQQLAASLLNTVRAVKEDPKRVMEMQGPLNAVQSQVTPEAFAFLTKFADNASDKLKLMQEHFDRNEAWVSAQRNGRFIFEYWRGNERVRASADDMKEAQVITEGRPIIKDSWQKNERPESASMGPASDEIVKRFRELETNQREMLRLAGADDELLKHFDETAASLQFEKESANNLDIHAQQNVSGRRLTKGAQYLPWTRNHFAWVGKNASYWEKRVLKSEAGMLVGSPDYQSAPETRQKIKDHLESYLAPDGEAAQTMQKMASMFALSWGPATALGNFTQTYVRGVPELISMGHGIVAAHKEWSRAVKDFSSHKFGEKGWGSEMEQKFMTEAIADRQVDSTSIDENAMAQETTSMNFLRRLDGHKPKTTGQRLGQLADAVGTAGMWGFKQGEKVNNSVMLLAAFRTAQKTKSELGYAGWKQLAYEVNGAVNDTGGRANRAIGLYSKLGTNTVGRFTAMAMGTLQSYTFGVANQLIRYLKQGLFRPKGLTPAEVYSARKAAVTMLSVQFAMAGALGMPFVAGAMALLNQAFPDLQLNKKIRENVAGFFGSDDDNGHAMTNAFMSGVPSMLGWDWGSRLGTGTPIPGVNDRDGFNLNNMFGVPASLAAGFFRGTRQLSEGDPNGAFNFVPPGFRRLAQYASNDGKVLDYRNRPVLDPTPGEKVGLTLGFNPTRMAEFNAAQRMTAQMEESNKRAEEHFHQQQAEAALKGQFGSVKQAVLARKVDDPNFDAATAIRGIAQSAQDLTFPRDLRDAGSRARGPLLGLWNLPNSTPSEEAKTMFRARMERELGLVTDHSSSLMRARQLDQLRAANPKATMSELRAQLVRGQQGILLDSQE